MKTAWLPLFVLIGSTLPLVADPAVTLPWTLNFSTALSGQYDSQTGVSNKERIGIEEQSGLLDLHMLLEINNDQKYGSDVIYLSNTNNLGSYLLVDRGDLVLKGLGMTLQAGRFLPKDETDSPYSLVFNPNGMAKEGIKFSASVGPLTYSSEWVQLNYQSNFGSVADTPPAWQYQWNGTSYTPTGTGFPDRGVNVHNFVFQSGAWTVGLQDQSIYSGRAFDSEYFFSPMPQYFTEYLHSIAGRPWTAYNQLDKYMMGFFGKWKESDRDAAFQFQLADFNLHFLNAKIFPDNPAKFAWSAGGHWKNAAGRWGLFHAGATKYMYEAMTVGPGSESVRDVGNFAFPDTVYRLNGAWVPMDLNSNEIGYTNGENNVALLATWDDTFQQNTVKLGATLEVVIAGENAPANPWQGEISTPTSALGTQLLTDPVLEKKITADLRADWSFGAWMLSSRLVLGEALNVLQLQDAPGVLLAHSGQKSVLTTLVKNWVPSQENRGIFTFAVAVRYDFDATPFLTP